MEQQEVKASVENILTSTKVGSMATVTDNKPHSRYMTFHHKDLKLYTATNRVTDKVDEIEENPYTHILLGYEGEGLGDDYVEYTGKAAVNNSSELKKQLWNGYMEKIFDGPEDPNYVVLEIEPVHIQLMNKNGMTSHALEI